MRALSYCSSSDTEYDEKCSRRRGLRGLATAPSAIHGRPLRSMDPRGDAPPRRPRDLKYRTYSTFPSYLQSSTYLQYPGGRSCNCRSSAVDADVEGQARMRSTTGIAICKHVANGACYGLDPTLPPSPPVAPQARTDHARGILLRRCALTPSRPRGCCF